MKMRFAGYVPNELCGIKLGCRLMTSTLVNMRLTVDGKGCCGETYVA